MAVPQLSDILYLENGLNIASSDYGIFDGAEDPYFAVFESRFQNGIDGGVCIGLVHGFMAYLKVIALPGRWPLFLVEGREYRGGESSSWRVPVWEVLRLI